MTIDDPKPPMTLGHRIREAREVAGISLRQLALRIGRDSGYISRLEADFYQKPNLEVLEQIAGVLDVPYGELISLTGRKLPEDLLSLTRYLAAKYSVDQTTASKLADQFTAILQEQGISERPPKSKT